MPLSRLCRDGALFLALSGALSSAAPTTSNSPSLSITSAPSSTAKGPAPSTLTSIIEVDTLTYVNGEAYGTETELGVVVGTSTEFYDIQPTITESYQVFETPGPSLTRLELAGESSTLVINEFAASTVQTLVESGVTDVYAEFPSSTVETEYTPSSTFIDHILPATTVQTQFNPTETLVFLTPELYNKTTLFYSIQPSYTIYSESIPPICWYPISGNYGRLPRILFYFSIVFALVGRKVPWLIAGALAAALTYSGAASIHAMLLVWTGKGRGELDQQALLAILSTACIISIPLLNWSDTLRTLGVPDKTLKEAEQKKENIDPGPTRTIIVYWAFLVTVGYICIFVSYIDKRFSVGPLTYSSQDSITCSPFSGQLDFSAGQHEQWTQFFPSQEFIAGNNCVDPCSFDPIHGAIFRSTNDLATPSASQIDFIFKILSSQHSLGQYNLTAGSNLKGTQNPGANIKHPDPDLGKVSKIKFFHRFELVNLFLIPYIVLQGLWAILFGRRRPRQVRDSLFLFITELNVMENSPARDHKRRTAMIVASLSYAWALGIAVVCPILFVLNLVANELSVNSFPQNESARHIGAWSPYAATGLVLVAALIAKFHKSLEEQLIILINASFDFFRNFSHTLQRLTTYRGLSYQPPAPESTRVSAKETFAKFRTFLLLVLKAIASAKNPIVNFYKDSLKASKTEWRNDRHWLKSPEEISRHTDRHGFNIDKHKDGSECIIQPKGQWWIDVHHQRPKGQFKEMIIGGHIVSGAQSISSARYEQILEEEKYAEWKESDRVDFSRLPGSKRLRGRLTSLGVIHPQSPTSLVSPAGAATQRSAAAQRNSQLRRSEVVSDDEIQQIGPVPPLPTAPRNKFGQPIATVHERSVSDLSSRDSDHLLEGYGRNEDPDHIHPALRNSIDGHGAAVLNNRSNDERDHPVSPIIPPGQHSLGPTSHHPPISVFAPPYDQIDEEEEEAGDGDHAQSPTHELQQSLADSIRSRPRRSMVYSPATPAKDDPSPGPPPPQRPVSTFNRELSASHSLRSHPVNPPPPSRSASIPSIPLFTAEEIEHIGRSEPPTPARVNSPLLLLSPYSAEDAQQPFSNNTNTARRSTMSYLQVERPRTMQFDDVITLRKVNGVYRIVEPGDSTS
ncbi:hypothetical protein MMC25_007474 [Agyrium rufum]|nr:hypothetical protein [Agyrium rufum]